jgi:hypothetical protein
MLLSFCIESIKRRRKNTKSAPGFNVPGVSGETSAIGIRFG